MDIYIYIINIYIYNILYNMCVLHTTAICQLSSSLCWQERLLPARSRGWSPTSLPWLIFRIWSYENVCMVRGIIWCFLQTPGSDLFFTSQIPLFWGKHDFQVDWLDAKFHHGKLGKRLSFFEKGFHILEKGVYISEEGRFAAIRRYSPLLCRYSPLLCRYSPLLCRYSPLFAAIIVQFRLPRTAT